MLARTPRRLCLECGADFSAPGFVHYRGAMDNGPAYWSDQGILCGPACAAAHLKRRLADGSYRPAPCDCPVSVEDLLAAP